MGSVARKRLKLALLGAAGALAIGAGVSLGADWLRTGRYLEATNDAYVKADYTTIAPKVSGYVSGVLVEDNDAVKAGQVLARIDARDFRMAVDRAIADVAAAEAGIDNIDAQLGLQSSLVEEAKADTAAAEAQEAFARQDYRRYQDLLKTGYGTVQRAQQAQAILRQQSAQLERGRAALIAAEQQIEVLKPERAQAETALAHAKAAEEQAQPLNGLLRAGMSVEATVDTKPTVMALAKENAAIASR